MAAPSAKLSISPSIPPLFTSPSPPRSLILQIVGEEIQLLKQVGSSSSNDTVQSDFDNLPIELESDTPAFVLFKTDVSKTDSWLLIAWIPDMSMVRMKMLYSSSKDHLKEVLGKTYFTPSGDYYGNEAGDLTYANYTASLVKTVTLNAHEEFLKSEKIDALEAGGGGGSNMQQSGGGVVPFRLTEEAKSELEKYNNGAVHAVSLTLDATACTIGLTQFFDAKGINIIGAIGSAKLGPKVSTNSPSFLVVRSVGSIMGAPKNIFVYSCPEEAPVREKMVYSTAKSSAVTCCGSLGIVFDSNIEVSDPLEIDEELTGATAPKKEGGATGSAASEIKHAKPARPGKGKARMVKKFVMDDE